MNRLKCEYCGKSFPMNEMLKASGQNFCKDCAEKALQDTDNPLEGTIEHQVDPTLCTRCGYDNGSTSLEKIAGLPICQQCGDFLRNRPFPQWIKFSTIALIMFVIFSLFLNWRFIRAYQEMNRSYEYSGNGEIEKAAIDMSIAAQRVPESEALGLLAVYMESRFLLWQDKSQEALKKLELCVNKLPPEYGVDDMILHARLGVAFDTKNYDDFLACAVSIDQKYPDDFISKASLASAYACKYAESEDQEYKSQALSFLDISRKMADNDPSFKKYENRILHRLYSREIITSEEFNKRFPDGWINLSDE